MGYGSYARLVESYIHPALFDLTCGIRLFRGIGNGDWYVGEPVNNGVFCTYYLQFPELLIKADCELVVCYSCWS